MDREKIIKGLEKCKRHECDNCTEKGASQAPWDCPAYDDFIDSALALLKEQEPAKPREERHEVKISYDWGDEVEIWTKFYCPHCGAMIANGNSQHFPRCMWCGRKVKWK